MADPSPTPEGPNNAAAHAVGNFPPTSDYDGSRSKHRPGIVHLRSTLTLRANVCGGQSFGYVTNGSFKAAPV